MGYEKENKTTTIEKEEVKPSLFPDDMIVYAAFPHPSSAPGTGQE